MVTRKQIEKVLDTVLDPELGIPITDLGLVYGIKTDTKGTVEIEMTLTTIGCPLFNLIADPIRSKIKKVKGVKKVDINLTFDPPWSPDRMSKEAKIHLGFL